MTLNVRDWKSRSPYLLLCSDINFLRVLGQAIYFNCLLPACTIYLGCIDRDLKAFPHGMASAA